MDEPVLLPKKPPRPQPEPDHFFRLSTILPLPDECITGGRPVSRYILGRDDPAAVKALYHLLENHRTIPKIKFGGQWAVFPSYVQAKFWAEQSEAFPGHLEHLVKLNLLLSGLLPFLVDLAQGIVMAEDVVQVAHIVNEATIAIEKLLRVKRP
jgi:hypothetical protein